MTPVELLRLIENQIRTGIVDSVDAGAGTVVVRWPSGVTSRAMPWAVTSAAFYAEPVVGDQAIVLSPSGDPANAIALVGVASTDADRGDKSAAARADLVKDELDDIRDKHDNHTHPFVATGAASPTSTPTTPIGPAQQVGANFVKVD